MTNRPIVQPAVYGGKQVRNVQHSVVLTIPIEKIVLKIVFDPFNRISFRISFISPNPAINPEPDVIILADIPYCDNIGLKQS